MGGCVCGWLGALVCRWGVRGWFGACVCGVGGGCVGGLAGSVNDNLSDGNGVQHILK